MKQRKREKAQIRQEIINTLSANIGKLQRVPSYALWEQKRDLLPAENNWNQVIRDVQNEQSKRWRHAIIVNGFSSRLDQPSWMRFLCTICIRKRETYCNLFWKYFLIFLGCQIFLRLSTECDLRFASTANLIIEI